MCCGTLTDHDELEDSVAALWLASLGSCLFISSSGACEVRLGKSRASMLQTAEQFETSQFGKHSLSLASLYNQVVTKNSEYQIVLQNCKWIEEMLQGAKST